MSDRRLRLLAWLGLTLLAVLCLARIGGFVLQDPDEGRYAEIPREMIESGDWITPRLNYVTYFEKPPLLYWLVALAFRVFGTTEWAARLTPALAGIATVLLAYRLGRALFGRRAALIGAALLATSPVFFVLSQVLVIDMLLTACFTAALTALYAAHRAEAKGTWAVAAAIAAALGVLAKGPVALLLPGAIGVAFLLLRRDFATLRAFLAPAPIAAFALVAVPWFVLVSLRNPEFPEIFFVREHLERFATEKVGHPEGPFYYLPVLLLGPMPWTLLAAVLACSARGRAAFAALDREAKELLGLWAGLVIVFFSVASSKLAPYILPALPPLALLAGAWIDRLVDDAPEMRRALRLVAWCLAALGAGAALAGAVGLPLAGLVAPRFDIESVDVRGIAFAALWAGLVLAASAALALREWNGRRASAVAALVVLLVGLGVALLAAVGARSAAKSSRDLALAVGREAGDGATPLVVSYRRLMQSLSFYTRGRVTLVDPSERFNEIGKEARRAPDYARFFWTDVRQLSAAWRSGRKVFVATDHRMVPELAEILDPPPRLLARDGRRVLIVNFPAPDGGDVPRDTGSAELESRR